MSLGKLKRTLHRELTRNPVKTGTLLALLPVAGYFIVPLLWKQTPASKSAPSEPASFVAVAAGGLVAAAASAPTPTSWKEVAGWMAQDARRKPVETSGLRNPFQKVTAVTNQVAESDRQDSAATAPPPKLRPEELGLQLSATIIGRSKRMATINGRLYFENSKVPIKPDGESEIGVRNSNQSFVLKTVAKNHVVLERDGQLFRLQIAGGQPN